jgi:adenine-specific DNA-methyltransferase
MQKILTILKSERLPRTEEANARYSNPDNDPRGVWMSSDLSVKTYNPANGLPIITPAGNIINPPSGRCWRTSKEAFDKLVKEIEYILEKMVQILQD